MLFEVAFIFSTIIWDVALLDRKYNHNLYRKWHRRCLKVRHYNEFDPVVIMLIASIEPLHVVFCHRPIKLWVIQWAYCSWEICKFLPIWTLILIGTHSSFHIQDINRDLDNLILIKIMQELLSCLIMCQNASVLTSLEFLQIFLIIVFPSGLVRAIAAFLFPLI